MSAHTPGPWGVVETDDGFFVRGPDDHENAICDIVNRAPTAFTDEDLANARLIAAAPRMLAALKLVANGDRAGQCAWCGMKGHADYCEVGAAIAEAEGRAE